MEKEKDKTNYQYLFWIENALNGYILKVRNKDIGEEHKEIYYNLNDLQSRLDMFLTSGSMVKGNFDSIREKLRKIEKKRMR
jgi:hypothetical protein